MRQRKFAVQFYLDDKELEHLDSEVRRTGLNRSSYLRMLILNRVPKERPDQNWEEMRDQLRRIGVTLNQIAHVAHRTNIVDKEMYQEQAALLQEVYTKLGHEALLPEKVMPLNVADVLDEAGNNNQPDSKPECEIKEQYHW